MAQRHDHDTVERLWDGAADPTDLRYVPVELRKIVANIDADTERKLRRELYITREVVVTDGRKATRTLNPSTDEDDLELALVVSKNRWARQQLDSDRATAEQAARDAVTYGCHCCGQVVLPGTGGGVVGHTQRRSFVDGTTVTAICGRCAAVAERLAVDRLAADRFDGRTRADLAAALLERTRT